MTSFSVFLCVIHSRRLTIKWKCIGMKFASSLVESALYGAYIISSSLDPRISQ